MLSDSRLWIQDSIFPQPLFYVENTIGKILNFES